MPSVAFKASEEWGHEKGPTEAGPFSEETAASLSSSAWG
jgi:hypothetical protein